MLVEKPLSLLSVELQSGTLIKVSKMRTVQRTETEEILHNGFRMQFTETEKQTALAKPTVL
ncbi:hypothetical protein LBK6_11235 [Leptospira borgpetersenii serovar Hardjo]|nr:hypothetical protein LBK6_11235 [Leptospira borgpetersenii serovar Hardjo]AMX65383.1 hypothetical protein LBK30_11300 [Leptospira borgpetersenii serovar Hardjo]AMX68593.1 hypothetical protein LBHA_11135 [Leptospira borgpetersenii serovar Hardjo]AMX71853.1 hypothetical protein LBHB_11480 [Leptospira borgpetersenii serovar Hardjo]